MQTATQATEQGQQISKAVKSVKALRKPAVLDKTGLSNTQLYRLIQKGDFPSSYKLSERVAVWNEAEVDAWLAAKFAA